MMDQSALTSLQRPSVTCTSITMMGEERVRWAANTEAAIQSVARFEFQVPMAVWLHLWLAITQADSWNFSKQSQKNIATD